MRGIVALLRVCAASLIAAGGLALGCGEFGARVVDLKRGSETARTERVGAAPVTSMTTAAATGSVVRRGRS